MNGEILIARSVFFFFSSFIYEHQRNEFKLGEIQLQRAMYFRYLRITKVRGASRWFQKLLKNIFHKPAIPPRAALTYRPFRINFDFQRSRGALLKCNDTRSYRMNYRTETRSGGPTPVTYPITPVNLYTLLPPIYAMRKASLGITLNNTSRETGADLGNWSRSMV